MSTSSAAGRFATLASLAASLVVVLPAFSAAQEPVKSFDQLNNRLKAGDTVWVTDAQGREQKGVISDVSANALSVLDGGIRHDFHESDVSSVAHRQGRSLKTPVLVGLALGGALGTVMGVMAEPDSEMGNDADVGAVFVGAAVGAGVGAGIGAAIGALKPGKKVVVYRAPGVGAPVRLSIAPVITPHTKGVAVAVTF